MRKGSCARTPPIEFSSFGPARAVGFQPNPHGVRIVRAELSTFDLPSPYRVCASWPFVRPLPSRQSPALPRLSPFPAAPTYCPPGRLPPAVSFPAAPDDRYSGISGTTAGVSRSARPCLTPDTSSSAGRESLGDPISDESQTRAHR